MSKEWTIEKRFSEFLCLKANLSKCISDLPKFPKKSIFSVSSSDKKLNKRKLNLETAMISLSSSPEVINNRYFQDFLEFTKHVPEFMNRTLTMVGLQGHRKFTYRDIIFDSSKKIMIHVRSDFKIMNRIDSRLLNMNLPFAKKSENNISKPLGVLGVYLQVKTDRTEFSFERLWDRKFKM